jgi:hypothetical protein
VFLTALGKAFGTDATDWLAKQPDDKTAWNTCPDPRWMLWAAQKAGVDRALLLQTLTQIVGVPTAKELAVKANPELGAAAIVAHLACCDGKRPADMETAMAVAADLVRANIPYATLAAAVLAAK